MTAPARQIPLPFALAPVRFAPAVLEAPSNAAARAWLAPAAAWPQSRLAIWGPRASGKSSLLRDWAERRAALVVAGRGLRFRPLASPPAMVPLAIDDAHEAPELALLHTLNAATEAGRAVLLAAPLPPARWNVALPDLASRLRTIVAVAIEAPEDTLLHALLARLLAARQLRVPMATLHWLLARLPRTHAAIADAVARLDEAAQCDGVAIGPALARQVLPDLLADLPDDIVDEPPAAAPASVGLATEDLAREDLAMPPGAPSSLAGGLL